MTAIQQSLRDALAELERLRTIAERNGQVKLASLINTAVDEAREQIKRLAS